MSFNAYLHILSFEFKHSFSSFTKPFKIIFRYFVFTSKHLEGYPMWPSTYSFGYNSMDVGPKRDIVGELERAFRQKHPDLHFGLYYCLWEFDNPIWLNDLSNNKTTR